MSILLGADPELLLVDDANNYRSVEGLVGGTKAKPVPIPTMEQRYEEGFAMQEDNVMLEFNIAPQRSFVDFDHAVDSTLTVLKREVLLPHGLYASDMCSAEYGSEQLQSGQAATFGCSPDLDAYARDKAAGVSPTLLGDWRCAGGHIHLGYDNPSKVPHFIVATLADSFMGLQEVALGKTQGIRRQYYGSCGRYRVKPYGIEYRTLSNNWLFSADLCQRVAMGAEQLADMVDRGCLSEIQHLFTEIPHAEVRRAINNEDESLAHELVNFINGVRAEVRQ